MERFVVVGAGHAGGHAVSTLRAVGFEGAITLIGEEPYAPYERPPLSKQFLAGDMAIEATALKPDAYYPEKQIDLRLETRVTALDREGGTVILEHGGAVPYDKLLLATGTRVRRLELPGADLAGVHYLRSIADVLGIRGEMSKGATLVIVGGGYIGLEVAAVAVRAGCRVTVLEAQDRIMNRVVAPQVSAFYDQVHRAEGVDIHTGVAVSGFEGEERVKAVLSAGGHRFAADLVVVGVGVIPNTELAEDAGLKVDNGICVDEYARTGDSRIFAAGDVTNHPNALLGRNLRLESVQNAVSQATTAANTMCGNLKPYAEVPWFWSDQYDIKLQMVGLSEPDDQVVVRGDPSTREFSVVYLRNGSVVALNAINNRRDFMHAKKLIIDGRVVDPAKVADPDQPLKTL